MSFTNDPTNSVRDRIRINTGDIDVFEEGLTDEIYDYIIAKHTENTVVNEVQATVEALRALVAKYANYVTEKAGGLFAKESDRYKHYKDLLDEFTKNPTNGFMKAGTGFAGGIYCDDIASNEQNSNSNLNPFFLGSKGDLFM